MNEIIQPLTVEATRARLHVLRMLRAGGAGHLGGALSCIDIVTALYFHAMNVDPANPRDPNRDRFLLSAGHKAMAQYAVLARRGFFDEGLLDTYGDLDSRVAGHPDMHKLPGIEANTGALGHGLSIACGMALGLRAAHSKARVFTILGDGELPEGSNWEGAAIASHYKLGNLTAFIDVNDLQISGRTADVMKMEPIALKFRAFGWDVVDINGNSMVEVVGAIDYAAKAYDKPTAVVARTTKAKGISHLESTAASHYWKPAADELDAAEAELRELLAALSETVPA